MRRQRTKAEALLTPREAAAEVGVSYATVKQWILAGKLKSRKTPGGHHRVPQSALAPLVDSTSPGSASGRANSARPGVESRERFRTVSGRNQLVGKIVEVKF